MMWAEIMPKWIWPMNLAFFVGQPHVVVNPNECRSRLKSKKLQGVVNNKCYTLSAYDVGQVDGSFQVGLDLSSQIGYDSHPWKKEGKCRPFKQKHTFCCRFLRLLVQWKKWSFMVLVEGAISTHDVLGTMEARFAYKVVGTVIAKLVHGVAGTVALVGCSLPSFALLEVAYLNCLQFNMHIQ
ncbi:hypothetical protein VNO78_10576 [Psophocarpus tetragonolobus]|uniref:Uncharacterized protein n=1 Tax=Psophocarpus tetragonolobus TaxID=3891 RepID=A0AAN9SRJ6_PSOTE